MKISQTAGTASNQATMVIAFQQIASNTEAWGLLLKHPTILLSSMIILWAIGGTLPFAYGSMVWTIAAVLTFLVTRTYSRMIQGYETLIKELTLKTTRDETGRVVVSLPGAPKDVEDVARFEQVFESAIEADKAVAFKYQDREGNMTEREITPWYVQSGHNGLLVTGHCHLRDEERNFYLDRMSDVRISGEGRTKGERQATVDSTANSWSSSLDDVPF